MNGIYYNEITGKIDRYVKKEHALSFSIGLQKTIIISSAVFFLFTILEMVFHFSTTGRAILFFGFIVSAIAPFFYYFIFPLLKYFYIAWKPDYFTTANRIGTGFPEIKDELYNAMQLQHDHKPVYSGSLIDAAFMQLYNKTRDIKFENAISFNSAKTLFKYTVLAFFTVMLLTAFIPSLKAASGRVFKFNREFVAPAKFSFEVFPGNARLTKGDNLKISFKVIGPLPSGVNLFVKTSDQTEFETPKTVLDSTGFYSYNISAVQTSLSYYVQAEDVRSDLFNIEVTDRPVIKRFDLTITPPGYSRMPQIKQEDNGNVTSLIGTSIDINVYASKPLKKALLKFADTTEVNLAITSYNAAGRFRIKDDNSYQIYLIDENSDTNSMPVRYELKALYDAYPTMEVLNPQVSSLLSNDNRIPAYLKIADDYGFSRLTLNYRLSESKYSKSTEKFTSIDIPVNKGLKEEDINYIWNLSKLALAANDVVSFYFEIFDNDNVSGPKSVKSSMFAVRVPSLDELLTRADQTQKDAGNELSETFKEAEELRKDLEKIDQDLKKNQKELSWDEKQKIEKAVDKFQQLQNKVDNVNKNLSEMQQELRENNLLSKETMQKYMELQKIMDQLTSDEMKKAMEKMQDVLKSMNRQQAQENMKDFKLDEEAFKKSIERTMNLLKRLQVEQKVDELVKRTEEIIKKQEELQQQTKESDLNNKNQKENLADQQDKLKNEMDKLNEEMKDLAEKMSDLKDLPKDEAEKMQQDFEKQENQELSEQSSESIKQSQKQQAMNKQSQISKNMKQMQKQMKDLQQQMMQKNQMQAFTDMMKAMDNLVQLSQQQEQLRKETQSLNPGSPKFDQNAQKQNALDKNLDKVMQQLSELSQKTFAITPEMGKALGDAKKNMQRSTQELQNNNGPASSNSQQGSMASLNEAAAMIKSSMESMMNGQGQGSGMMSLMQQLQKMSGQQMSLNNMMQQLQQGNQGQLSPQQQAEFQRLGQQQELIRKSLEQLNQEARMSGESKKLPANLENVNQQMKEVISDIRSEKLNPELIQKQERILSKLLDAQKSLNERDYEKERESFTGKNITRQSPPDINLTEGKGKDKIKDELNKAVQEGYKKDYEELIRRYFEALRDQK